MDINGPHYFVMFHTPGPNWTEGVAYNKQPEIEHHIEYMSELHDKGLIVLSGPFMLKAGGFDGVFDNGGMTVFKATDLAAAEEIASDDPTVKSGIIAVDVKLMWVPFYE